MQIAGPFSFKLRPYMLMRLAYQPGGGSADPAHARELRPFCDRRPGFFNNCGHLPCTNTVPGGKPCTPRARREREQVCKLLFASKRNGGVDQVFRRGPATTLQAPPGARPCRRARPPRPATRRVPHDRPGWPVPTAASILGESSVLAGNRETDVRTDLPLQRSDGSDLRRLLGRISYAKRQPGPIGTLGTKRCNEGSKQHRSSS